MDYELAKQLKDAGFPLKYKSTGSREWTASVPTLSELIEMCGDNFVSLDRFGITATGVQWVCNKDKPWRSQGKTAEECVANLWLSLNKKGE